MADYGLLTGLAEGLKSGVDSYRTERDYQSRREKELEDKALQKRMMALQLIGKGLQEDDSGGFIKTPGQERAEAMAGAQEDAKLRSQGFIADYDPTTKKASLSQVPGFKNLDDEMKRAQIAKLRAEANTKDGGKLVPAGQVVENANSTAASIALQDVSDLVGENAESFGPVQGRMSGLMGKIGLNPQAQLNTAAIKQRAQIIGKYLEGGKMTDSDIVRYEAALPQLSDSPEVAQGKVQSLKRLIAQKQSAELSGLQGAGYNTKGIPLTQSQDMPGMIKINPSKVKSGGFLQGPNNATASDKIRVSNGSETLLIDPNDVGAARKDGYSVVK